MRVSEQRSRSQQISRSERGESRHFKIPILSKLRIGGDVGKAAEAIKKKVPSVASWIGTGTPVGAIMSAANGTLKEDAIKGLKNVPFVYGGVKALQHMGAPGFTDTNGDPTTGNPNGSNNGDIPLGNWLDLALGGANLFGAAQLGQKSTDYANKAGASAEGSYNERAPLRLAGIQGMLNPSAGNATALAGVNAVKGPQIAAQPIPLPLNDPRFAALNMVAQRNPMARPPVPPLPLRGI